ncbi:MAG: sulfatase [Planctomycetota bacterium]|jgi:arylsulfatase A-like enzyme|nr:sulfatase [Planctomycetota bacterium]MDP6941081.1 sulfatase [Planctomycetota bacterium]
MPKVCIPVFFALLFCECSTSSRSPAHNVVVISIDSLRRDHLGCYGHAPEFAPTIPVSPAIDQLADEGILFENAFSTSSWTLPSHAALMTGMDDRAHGVEAASRMVDPLHPMLAEKFREGGWQTWGFFSGGWLDPRHGFDRGFDIYQSGILNAEETRERVMKEQERVQEIAPGIEWDSRRLARLRKIILRYDSSGERITDMALAQLNSSDDSKPFFLFLHYFDVHHDYVPEEVDSEIAHQFDPTYAGSVNGRDWTEKAVVGPHRQQAVTNRDLAHIRALYDAEIHLLDSQLERVFNALKEKGLWENTLVILTSDHGEEFFDHGGITHARTLHSEMVQIPLILKLPNALKTKASKRVGAVARIHDVADTLLDYSGLSQMPFGEGRSLRPLIHGSPGNGGALSRLQVFSTRGMNIQDSWRNQNFSILRAFTSNDASGSLQVIRHPSTGQPAIQVFDLRVDPKERSPLSSNDPRWLKAMAAFQSDFSRSESAALKVPRSDASLLRPPHQTEEEREFLEALGYAEEAQSERTAAPYSAFPEPSPR